MQPYQQRVIQEKADLDGKLERLKEFLYLGEARSVHEDEVERLKRQVDAMAVYSAILAERIEAFQ